MAVFCAFLRLPASFCVFFPSKNHFDPLPNACISNTPKRTYWLSRIRKSQCYCIYFAFSACILFGMTYTKTPGFALLEVLLAWSLLMVALSSMLFVQVINLRKIQHSYFLSIGWTQLQSMAERLRVNSDSVSRSREKIAWNLQNKELLPLGEGDFVCKQQVCMITLRWKESDKQTISEMMAL